MMNQRFESSDQDPPLPDELSQLEQQLRAIEPRAARLNWEAITASTTSAAVTGTEQPDVAIRTLASAVTMRQLLIAVAASWLLGMAVGGGSIFWWLSSRPENAISNNTALVPTVPAEPAASSAREALPTKPQANVASAQPTLVDHQFAEWLASESAVSDSAQRCRLAAYPV